MNKNGRPKLGDRISFSKILKRYEKLNSYQGEPIACVEWSSVDLKEEREGVYMGIRYKQNGRIHFFYNGPSEWEWKETVACALVVFHERRNPVYVRFEDLKRVA